MGRKKKRTPKQIAATKKLVAFNKKRRTKKRSTKKRSANPRKKTRPVTITKRTGSSYVYYVVKVNRKTGVMNKNPYWYDGVRWTSKKSKAAKWNSQTTAFHVAKSIIARSNDMAGVYKELK